MKIERFVKINCQGKLYDSKQIAYMLGIFIRTIIVFPVSVEYGVLDRRSLLFCERKHELKYGVIGIKVFNG